MPQLLRPRVHFLVSVESDRPKTLDDGWSRSCWCIWHQRTGTTRLSRLGESWILRPGAVSVAQPGTTAAWAVRAHVARAVFDVVHDAVQAMDGAESKPPATVQPDARAVFGCGLRPVVPADYGDDILPILRQMDAPLDADPWIRQEASLRLGLWLIRYARFHAETPPIDPMDPDLVRKAERLMGHGTRRRYTVRELARTLGVSASTLERAFVQVHGHGPGIHMQRRRLREAADILVAKEWPIARVARHVGFASMRGLQAAFTRVYGMSPRDWRRRARS